MLRFGSSLHFPSLIRVGETQLKSKQETIKATTLYRLDWSRLDSEREQKWIKWCSESRSSYQTHVLAECYSSLPEPYDSWVKSLVFSIPIQYIDEIRRVSRMAVIEWSTERHFDTWVREVCLEPAVAYAYVAFKLLVDCLYDSKTNYYYRGDNKAIAPQALLYKFWSGQTGSGCVRQFAKFEQIEVAGCTCSEDEECNRCSTTIGQFLKAMNKFDVVADDKTPKNKEGGSDDSKTLTVDGSGDALDKLFATIPEGQPALTVTGPVVINGKLVVEPGVVKDPPQEAKLEIDHLPEGALPIYDMTGTKWVSTYQGKNKWAQEPIEGNSAGYGRFNCPMFPLTFQTYSEIGKVLEKNKANSKKVCKMIIDDTHNTVGAFVMLLDK